MYPVSIDYKHFWSVYNARLKGRKMPYQLTVHAIELRNNYEKAVLAKANLLPLNVDEIKAVGFREFYRNLVRSKMEAKRLQKQQRQAESKKNSKNRKRKAKNG